MSPVSDLAEIAEDAALLREAVAGAADVAMRYFRRDPKMWKKGDTSPVSEADLAVNEYLQNALLAARPEYGWLSEESADGPERLTAPRVWIVDPIDGTRAFLDGKADFTICAALTEDGRVIAGSVGNPANAQQFDAVVGEGATVGGERLRLSDTQAGPGAIRLLASRSVAKSERWRGTPPFGERGYVGSIAYQLCLVAAGEWDAAVAVNRLHEWDLAAAALILSEAGGVLTDQTGDALRFNSKTPRIDGMIGARPSVHRAFADRLVPRA